MRNLLTVTGCLATFGCLLAAEPTFPLKISENRRHLVAAAAALSGVSPGAAAQPLFNTEAATETAAR